MRARIFVSAAIAALLAALPQVGGAAATTTTSEAAQTAPQAPQIINAKTDTPAAPSPESRSEPKPEAKPAAKPEAKPDTQEAAKKAPPKPVVTLNVDINLTTQRMKVTVGGKVQHDWPISSGRQGYLTPTGSFKPQWKAKMWYSRQWDDAPMPHAIFFHHGVAIHGTYETRRLGRPASHGCVRLAPQNAATLYALVGKHGMPSTRIVVHGTPRFHGDAYAFSDYEPRPPRDSGDWRYYPDYDDYDPYPRRRYSRRYDYVPMPFPWGVGGRRGGPFGMPGW
jgi:lipoprotein-anchoring transpeptidase ErfK/SrfK